MCNIYIFAHMYHTVQYILLESKRNPFSAVLGPPLPSFSEPELWGIRGLSWSLLDLLTQLIILTQIMGYHYFISLNLKGQSHEIFIKLSTYILFLVPLEVPLNDLVFSLEFLAEMFEFKRESQVIFFQRFFPSICHSL